MGTQRSLTPGDRGVVDRTALWALLIVLTGQAAAGVTETDIWGHMAIGLDTLAGGTLLRTDPYSFTHDQVWVNHEWLWDVGTAAVYRSAGLSGLLVLRACLIGSVLWLVLRASAGAPTPARGVALVAVAIVCSAQWHSTRPQLATLPVYGTVLLNPSAWWLPPLFALWANLHGGWMIGMGALGAFTLLNPSPRQFLLTAACAIATLVTPYGVDLWVALADAVARGWSDVSEWAPVWSRAAGIAPLWIWLAALALLAALWRRVDAGVWPWGWTILTFLAAAQSRRLLALAAVTAALLLMPRWRPYVPAALPDWTPGRRLIAGTALAAAAALGMVFITPTLTCFPPTPAWTAPEPDAVAFVRDAGVRGRAIVHFDFGEYVIFHLRDRLKVSIDNRRETVYSDEVVRAHLAFYAGRDPGYPARVDADLVWLPRSLDGVSSTLEQWGWVRRFEGPNTVILLRSPGDLVHARPSQGTPCFPYP